MKSEIREVRREVVGFACEGAASDVPGWREQLRDWDDLLQKCSQKPGGKRVHSLRTATLRIKAQLEYWFRGDQADSVSAQQARRWIKNADKLRKALSPVRDADVYLDMLRDMRSPAAGEAKSVSMASRDCLREVDRLERRLKRNREDAEKKLTSVLKKRGDAWDRISGELQKSSIASDGSSGRDIWATVRQIAVGLACDAPGITADTLHEFRKRAKAARYLAEILAPQDAEAKRQTAMLKKIQSSAGQWHDWQSLAAKAKKLLGDQEVSNLMRILDAIAQRSLDEALRACRQAASELVESEKQDGSARRQSLMKRPTRQAEPQRIVNQALSA